ncbi:MAG: hypothetical protein A2Z14_11220 [Chloroflexi bacterium RBG_16_48_8]|nr:MAG: hypothetical protein A2Z14_11220 [Chloroflexi bacterium RBG_16_48_8]
MARKDFKDIYAELDKQENFGDMRNTPYYEDAVYSKFSNEEYERRYRLTREKMARLGLDCLIVCGGPNHWSNGAGVTWLTGHREWHSLAVYVVVPMEGEPTLIYSMGGTHAEATRRKVYCKDVRPSRGGLFGEVMVERIKELGLDKGRIGLTQVDPQFKDHMPINQYNTLREGLPEAQFEILGDYIHEFILHKSLEEQAYVLKAGELAAKAIEAMAEVVKPGITEYELKAAAAFAILNGGGEVDFIIIGSCPMDEPALIFGNPRPSRRVIQKGDYILNELAAGFEGYTVQIGMPICVGKPTRQIRTMFDKIVLPGFKHIAKELMPGKTLADIHRAAQFFREHGYQSRPIIMHGIDLVSHPPSVTVEGYRGEDFGFELKPGRVMMLEPNPITPDGQLGLFFGHTFLITEEGQKRVTDRLPLELIVV